MNNIEIREATMNDIPGIMHIHRDCDDPFHDEYECRSWISRRLDRGFYIQLVLLDEKIVGHGQWIISDEPECRKLYLGMLQIDSDFQKMGIGRAMIEDGVQYGNKNNCEVISTIPEEDAGVKTFYKKCGFYDYRNLKRVSIDIEETEFNRIEIKKVKKVLISAVQNKEFVFGLAQASSRHMWEVCNEKPDSDERKTPSFELENGDYIQFSFFKPDKTALLLCWSNSKDYDQLIKHAKTLAYKCGLDKLNIVAAADVIDSIYADKYKVSKIEPEIRKVI